MIQKQLRNKRYEQNGQNDKRLKETKTKCHVCLDDAKTRGQNDKCQEDTQDKVHIIF